MKNFIFGLILYGYEITSDQEIPQNYRTRIVDDTCFDFPEIKMQQVDKIEKTSQYEHVYTNKYVSVFQTVEKILIEETAGISVLVGRNSLLYTKSIHNTADDIYKVCFRQGISILSKFHNRVVLHGNALLYKGKAVIIIAPSCYGKSTLSLAFHDIQKLPILSDDVILLSEDGTKIYTGYSNVWVRQDSFNYFRSSIEAYVDKYSSDKFCYDAGIKYDMKLDFQYEVGAILFLRGDVKDDTRILEIQTVEGNDLFFSLVRNRNDWSVLGNKDYEFTLKVLHEVSRKALAMNVRLKRGYHYLEEQTKTILKMIEEVTNKNV